MTQIQNQPDLLKYKIVRVYQKTGRKKILRDNILFLSDAQKIVLQYKSTKRSMVYYTSH